MTRLQWMFTGASAVVAGAFATALAVAPPAPTSATRAEAPTLAVAAPAPASGVSAPVPTVAAAVPARARAATAVARQASRPSTPARAFAPAEAGMLIAIDPETGEHGMPSPEQRAALGLDLEGVAHDLSDLKPVVHANGMKSLDVEGRMVDYAVVRRGKDGRSVIGCVQHPDLLDHVHLTPTALEEE